MAIHFSEKFHERLMKGFAQNAETDSMFSHDLDMEFSGVYTVHVTSIKTAALQDYNKATVVTSGSRYGASTEVEDEMQTFTMTQDKALNLTVDKGNNEGQFNMKKAGEIMKAETEEVISPYLDTYRLKAWADQGNHYELANAPSKSNIVTDIINMKNAMLDKYVPDQLQLTISRTYLPLLQLSTEWVGLDSLGGKTLPKGTLGEFYGMSAKPMPSSKMPANVPWMITHKSSIIAPTKIKKFVGHVDPPGINGDQIEFRMIHDAFVIGKKVNGVCAAVLNGNVQAKPTITIASGEATITSSGASVIKYTTDGTDPRFSDDAKTYSAKFAVTAGQVVRAVAYSATKYASEVAEAKA